VRLHTEIAIRIARRTAQFLDEKTSPVRVAVATTEAMG
jgi:hypothetical protein